MRLLSLFFGYLLSTLLFLAFKSAPQSSQTPLVEKKVAAPLTLPKVKTKSTPVSMAKVAKKRKAKKRKRLAPIQRMPLHLALALQDKDVVEEPKGSNRGHPIDDWRKEFKIKKPVPWCAIFGSVKSKKGKVLRPKVWSCAARDFVIKKRSWKLADVIYGRYKPKPGDYRVKTRRGGNHIDIFVEWDDKKKEGKVIGGNVADRVLLRRVTLQRMIADGTTHITEVDGCHRYFPAIAPSRSTTATSAKALSES